MMADKVLVLVYSLIRFASVASVESQEPGLYFRLSGTVYLPGDTILITDIGSNTTSNRSDPQSSLVCVTTNVNTNCCRGADSPNEKGRGEWYLPNGDSLRYTPDTNFYRARYIQQVRLYRKNGAMSPTGVFTCEVPNDANSTMNHTANITIDPLLNVMLTGSGDTLTAGQNYMLTCEASGGGSMEYTYTWLKNGSVVSGQNSSTYSFSPLLAVHSGLYSCQVLVGTMNVTSRSVNITVVELPVTTDPSTSTTTMETTMVTTPITSSTTPTTSSTTPTTSSTTPTTSSTTPTTSSTTTPTTTTPTIPPTIPPTTSTTPSTTPITSTAATPPPTTQPPTTLTTIPTTKTVRTTSMTPPTTKVTPLTVMVVSNGSVLSAGQNHTLACEANGGESMAYTYTWLKDGSVVSGQMSSTYSFSPLRVTDSGQYSCRVRVSFMTVTSGNVTITVEPPNTGLYFTLSGTVYLPGDTILITDIGSENTNDRSDPGSSLVCVTTNVNTHCCRSADNPNGGGRGEWYLPDRTRVLNTPDTNFYRTRYTRDYISYYFLSQTTELIR